MSGRDRIPRVASRASPARPGLPAPLHSPRPRGCRAAPALVSGPRRRLLLFLFLLFLLQPRPPARGLPCPGLRGAQPAGPPHRREPQGDGAAPARRLRPPPPHRAGPPPPPAPEPRGEEGSPAGTEAHGRGSQGCRHARGCAVPPAAPRDAQPLAPGAAAETLRAPPGHRRRVSRPFSVPWLLVAGRQRFHGPTCGDSRAPGRCCWLSVRCNLFVAPSPPHHPFYVSLLGNTGNLTLLTTMASVKDRGLVPPQLRLTTRSFCTVCSLSLLPPAQLPSPALVPV